MECCDVYRRLHLPEREVLEVETAKFGERGEYGVGYRITVEI